MKQQFQKVKVIDEVASTTRASILRVVEAQERWVRRLKNIHGLTDSELKNHCLISTYQYFDFETDQYTVKCRFTINWTRWMRFKRWWRGK